MTELRFKSLFFRLYDRKIGDGTITFSKLGISKSDFTRLCTEDDFVLDMESLINICEAMLLTEEEKNQLLMAAERERK